MREYGLSLLVAAALTFLVMPVVRSLALRAGAVAGVRDRDIHDHAIPRWGGLGMFLGLVAGMLLASKLPMMRTVFDSATKESVALLSGPLIIVLLGLVDDRWELDAPTKMAGQVLAAFGFGDEDDAGVAFRSGFGQDHRPDLDRDGGGQGAAEG